MIDSAFVVFLCRTTYGGIHGKLPRRKNAGMTYPDMRDCTFLFDFTI